MATKKIFDDGSSVEWIDKETLRYKKNNFLVDVWMDFTPGLFSSGRIIRSSFISKWNQFPLDHSEVISDDQRDDILQKIKQYYQGLNKKCEIE